jgi:TonB family protein
MIVTAALATPAAAQRDAAALGAAKDLYASARYDEALAVLNGLRSADRVDRRSVEQYRSLCLIALGRGAEAETAIAAVVTADPMYQPGEADASPRVRATFSDVRRRLLPDIARAQYTGAKASYDRREWPAAAQQFGLVLALLDDPDMGGRLPDLRVLAAGFLELSAKAAEPPPPPPPAAEPKPEPPAAPEPPPAPAAPDAAKIYTIDEAGVVAAAAIKQDIPRVPAALIPMSRPRGLLEVVVDEQGRVISMAVRASIHPTYDHQLLAAARDWKYRPATFNGQPVKFRRIIQIAVVR